MTWILSIILAIVVLIVINCALFLLMELDKATSVSVIAITLSVGLLTVITLIIHNILF